MIHLLGTLVPRGYNLTEGGRSGYKSEETKKKMSEAAKGEKNHNYAKKLPDVQRKKLIDSITGEKNPNYKKTGVLHPKSKKIYQYDLNDKYIRFFYSCTEAANFLEKSYVHISNCANGKRKTAYGFKWSYTLL